MDQFGEVPLQAGLEVFEDQTRGRRRFPEQTLEGGRWYGERLPLRSHMIRLALARVSSTAATTVMVLD
jgi:hypothetical protein